MQAADLIARIAVVMKACAISSSTWHQARDAYSGDHAATMPAHAAAKAGSAAMSGPGASWSVLAQSIHQKISRSVLTEMSTSSSGSSSN